MLTFAYVRCLCNMETQILLGLFIASPNESHILFSFFQASRLDTQWLWKRRKNKILFLEIEYFLIKMKCLPTNKENLKENKNMDFYYEIFILLFYHSQLNFGSKSQCVCSTYFYAHRWKFSPIQNQTNTKIYSYKNNYIFQKIPVL